MLISLSCDQLYDKHTYIGCFPPVFERSCFSTKGKYDGNPCYVKGQGKAMDFQNMIGSLIEIEVHDAKVVEVTNDRTKTYRTLKRSAVRLDQSFNFAVKKLYYGFRPDRGRWATSK